MNMSGRFAGMGDIIDRLPAPWYDRAMKKDDAMALRERLRTQALATAAKQGFPQLEEDGKFYHDEVADQARWAQRLSLKGRWPHLASSEGQAACPGLRYEAWFFPGKAQEETVLFMAVCDRGNGLEDFQKHLGATFKELVEGGKYARRYQPLEPIVTRFYAGATGVGRRVPVAKAEAAWTQLLEDTLKPLDGAVGKFAGAESLLAQFEAACSAYDPLAALRAKFGK